MEQHALTPEKSVLFCFKFQKFLIWQNRSHHMFPKLFLFSYSSNAPGVCRRDTPKGGGVGQPDGTGECVAGKGIG